MMIRFLLLVAVVAASATVCAAQLRRNYYAGVCPDVETIVRGAMAKKYQQTFITVGALVHLYFHDCFVQGCDASVLIASTANNTAEKDNSANLSLAGDGFDAVIKAKAALDAVPRCRNKVSCADILTMATRDAIALAGGPAYAVELGRLDGLSSTATSVPGKLLPPSSTLDQLTALFATNGLSQTDMVALSGPANNDCVGPGVEEDYLGTPESSEFEALGTHTVGLAHCRTFASRLRPTVDPTLNPKFAAQLQAWCPTDVDNRTAVPMDTVTPRAFDNQYFKNLQTGMGVLSSDQLFYIDTRTRPTVDAWAKSEAAFDQAFVTAMTKMGRIGVKTDASQGNIRHDCAKFN